MSIMMYKSTVLRERKLKELLVHTNVLIKGGWLKDGSIRSDGSFYSQPMKKVTNIK